MKGNRNVRAQLVAEATSESTIGHDTKHRTGLPISSDWGDDHKPRPTTVVLNRVIANVDSESGPIFPFVHPIACIAMDHVMGNIFFESWNLFQGPKLSRRHAHHLFARVAVQSARGCVRIHHA